MFGVILDGFSHSMVLTHTEHGPSEKHGDTLATCAE